MFLYLGRYKNLNQQFSEEPEYTIQEFSEAQRCDSCSDLGMNTWKKNGRCDHKMMESFSPTRIASLDVKILEWGTATQEIKMWGTGTVVSC